MKSPWFLRQCQVRSKYPIREEDHPGEFSVTLKRWTFPESKIFYKLKMISENLLRFLGPHFWIQYFRRLLFAKCNLALHVNSSIQLWRSTREHQAEGVRSARSLLQFSRPRDGVRNDKWIVHFWQVGGPADSKWRHLQQHSLNLKRQTLLGRIFWVWFNAHWDHRPQIEWNHLGFSGNSKWDQSTLFRRRTIQGNSLSLWREGLSQIQKYFINWIWYQRIFLYL